jgi:hypothetical protein
MWQKKLYTQPKPNSAKIAEMEITSKTLEADLDKKIADNQAYN